MPIPTFLILKYVEQCYVQVVLNYILVGCPCHLSSSSDLTQQTLSMLPFV